MLRAAASLCATLGLFASAAEPTSWPPPDGVALRMRELQVVLGSAQSTPTERQAARDELARLLKSPAGQSRRTPDEKAALAPRAAIEPVGPLVRPAVNPSVPVPGVATMEVITPPRITVSPTTGVPVAPSGRGAVDPRTGNVLHDAGNGYVDPRTGQFTPK